MKHIYRTDDEWMELIIQCRQSGLSDDRWCRDNGIPASSFYRHIRLLRQKACEIPSSSKIAVPLKQEVVPVQITGLTTPEPSRINTDPVLPADKNSMQEPAIHIRLGTACIDVMNHADTALLSAAVMALKVQC